MYSEFHLKPFIHQGALWVENQLLCSCKNVHLVILNSSSKGFCESVRPSPDQDQSRSYTKCCVTEKIPSVVALDRYQVGKKSTITILYVWTSIKCWSKDTVEKSAKISMDPHLLPWQCFWGACNIPHILSFCPIIHHDQVWSDVRARQSSLVLSSRWRSCCTVQPSAERCCQAVFSPDGQSAQS